MQHPTSKNSPTRGGQTSAANNEEQQGDFRIWLALLWYRRWLILFCLIVAASLGVIQLRRSVPSYTATAVLKYEPRAQQIVDLGERSSILYQRDEIATAVQLVKSPVIAEAVLEAIGRTPPPPPSDPSPMAQLKDGWIAALREVRSHIVTFKNPVIDPEIEREQGAIQSLVNSLSVVQRPETKLIEVRFTGNNPHVASRIANEFCAQFIRRIEEDKRNTLVFARDYLDQQIKDAKERLQESEQAVFDYSGESDNRVMNENLGIMIQTMTALNREVEETRNMIARLKGEEKAANDEQARRVLLSEDPIYSNLLTRMSELRLQRSALAAENEADFPALKKMDREIAALDGQISEQANLVAERVTGRLLVETEKMKALDERLAAQRVAISEMEKQMIEYRVLSREVESSRTIFTNLLDQYKRLEVADDMTPTNVTIVSKAPIPRLPTSPNVTRTLGGFLTAGMAVAVGLTLLLFWLDRSVKNPSLVEEKLSLATLGFIPTLTRKGGSFVSRKNKPAILLEQQAKSAETEAFHYLRTSIQFSSAVKGPRIILVTSCMPQEGKSTVSSNLGVFFSSRGQKTLVIDGDLKRPTMHRCFGVSRLPGLSDVLTGEKSLEDAIVKTPVSCLDLLPAGTASPSPINLLESEAMTQLLESLRGQYSTIILDSAPAFAMADSLILAAKVDGVVLVVRQGKTMMDVLEKTSAKLHSVGATVLGVVYNNASSAAAASLGSYGQSFAYDARTSNDDLPARS